MGKMKIHELAKELGLPSKEVLDKAKKLGIEVTSHLSNIEDEQANKIRQSYNKNNIKKENKVGNRKDAKKDTPVIIKREVILNDEDGNEVKFEFLDLIDLDDEEYVVLLPVTDEGEEDEGEVVILKLEDTDDDSEEESYVGVEDEEILNKVFEIFKEKYKDEFNFVDED